MRIATSATAASTSTEIAAHGFMYEACDIPPGMTIDEFRARGTTERHGWCLRRLRKRLRFGYVEPPTVSHRLRGARPLRSNAVGAESGKRDTSVAIA